jgi:hypothetical protein
MDCAYGYVNDDTKETLERSCVNIHETVPTCLFMYLPSTCTNCFNGFKLVGNEECVFDTESPRYTGDLTMIKIEDDAAAQPCSDLIPGC